MSKTSRISGFYKLKPKERLQIVREFAGLTDEEVNVLQSTGSLGIKLADRMIENVVGAFPVPLGIAVNFQINGRDYLVPMAIEEPSVVAAASYGAKMARTRGGFFTSSTEPIMIGQIQVVDVPDPYEARLAVLADKVEILNKANEQDPVLVSVGGGARDLDVKVMKASAGSMVIIELFVDCRDVMGANVVNTMAEAVAPLIERTTRGKVCLRIVSNLATKRLARARTVVAKEEVGGKDVVDGIIKAYSFAEVDPYRAATHNKGILNGIIAGVLATGNDHRAVEAGAHAYAARSSQYRPLTFWEKNKDGDLVGSIEIPMAVGVVGGVTGVHPTAKVTLKILGVKTASELGEVLAAVGLAQNLAALRALVHEGIQRGHMELHARNVAIAAGATGELVEKIVERMIEMRRVRGDIAKKLMEEYKRGRSDPAKG